MQYCSWSQPLVTIASSVIMHLISIHVTTPQTQTSPTNLTFHLLYFSFTLEPHPWPTNLTFHLLYIYSSSLSLSQSLCLSSLNELYFGISELKWTKSLSMSNPTLALHGWNQRSITLCNFFFLGVKCKIHPQIFYLFIIFSLLSFRFVRLRSFHQLLLKVFEKKKF